MHAECLKHVLVLYSKAKEVDCQTDKLVQYPSRSAWMLNIVNVMLCAR